MIGNKDREAQPLRVSTHDLHHDDHADNQRMVGIALRQIGFVVAVVIAASMGYYAKGREDKQMLAAVDKQEKNMVMACDSRIVGNDSLWKERMGERDRLLADQSNRIGEQADLIASLKNKTEDLTNKTADLTNKTNEIATKQDKTLQLHATELKAIKNAAKEAKTAAVVANTAVTKALSEGAVTVADRKQIDDLVKKGKTK